jgi:hypothetical protein
MGQNFNFGLPTNPAQWFVDGSGNTYIGPISIFLNSQISGTMAVTFLVLDFDSDSAINSSYFPVTVTVNDGSVSSPTTIFAAGSGATTAILNCKFPRVDNVSDAVSNNSPVAYQVFNQGMQVDAILPQPVTLYNYPVGSIAGTVAGMGASFDYSQFTVIAQDNNSQFLYQIPVVNDSASASAFGTFSTTVRTPNNVIYNGDPLYSFTVNSNGNFSSNTVYSLVQWGKSQNLPETILVNLLDVYMAVTVTQKGTAYPYGAWVSAQQWPGATPTPPSAPPTTGMGQSYSVNNYFSTVTKGDGTSEFQIQLFGGAATKYTITAQIVDPNTYAVTQQAQTITVPIGASFTSPLGVSFGF